jgi:hypothetical protein
MLSGSADGSNEGGPATDAAVRGFLPLESVEGEKRDMSKLGLEQCLDKMAASLARD